MEKHNLPTDNSHLKTTSLSMASFRCSPSARKISLLDKKIMIILFTFLLNSSQFIYAKENNIILDMHVRDRFPEIFIKDHIPQGPLIDIISEAAKNLHIKLKFIEAPFNRTLIDLKTGKVDLCPRLSKTPERETYVSFLGPIEKRIKITSFLVKKGKENSIINYSDLKKFTIATKIGSSYFDKFDNDNTIAKTLHSDDKNMSNMFKNNRFQVMAVTDKLSLENKFKEIHFTDYAYAKYIHIENTYIYYGFSKKSKHYSIRNDLNNELIKMYKNGRNKQIYKKYGL